MNEEIFVSIYFYADGLPMSVAKITELIGMNPTTSWNEDDPAPTPFIPDQKCGSSYWEYLCPMHISEKSLDGLITGLLDILQDKAAIVTKLSQQYETGITCACYFPDICPSFSLSADVLKKCADFNLSLRFELFCSDDEEQFMLFLSNRERKVSDMTEFVDISEEPINF